MFAAPKLIEAQFIEMLSQSQIALKLQSRVFADRVMRCQECAEPDARHQEFLRSAIMQFRLPIGARSRRTVRPMVASSDPFSHEPPIQQFQSIASDGNRLAQGGVGRQ